MKTRLLFCFIVFLLVSTNKAVATSYTWAGGASGNWTTASNWSPSTGYPSSNSDQVTISTSNITINLGSSLTVNNLKISNGYTGVTINFTGSSPTLTITSGITVGQPSSASTVLTFSGAGTALLQSTSSCSYHASMAISAGATVSMAANAVLDFTSNQGTLNNSGTFILLSGSNFKIGDKSSLSNSGTVTSSSATFTLSGNPCSLSNTGTFNATSSTFTISGSTIPVTNSGSGAFTTNKCTFSSSNSSNTLTNSATWTDHGSTFSITGQSNTITNSGASCNFRGNGTTITFSSGNTGMSLSNAGFFTADSASTINLGTQNCSIANTGTVYAGISNSSCIINLTGQGSNINNTGTFYVGSTSGITMSGLNAAITNSAFVIFQSDAYGSGYLGSVPASSVSLVTGTYYIERYITGGSATYRGYRLFSSPVYASTVSSNNVYSLNYVQSSALVTGSAGGGFDKTGNPSLYLYRENIAYSNATFISGNFRGISSISGAPTYTINGDAGNFNIPVGNGFLFWFRGDRTTNLANKYKPGTSAESVVMTATGTLNLGQITVHNWYTPASSNLGYTTIAGNTAVRGDNLVGNPYPSSIDWENFQTTTTTTGIYGTSVNNSIYVLDPVSKNYGAYIKGGGGVGTNGATNIIASGQGFFVTASSASAKLIFNESAKSTSQVTGSNLLMGRPADQTANAQYLRLQMAADSVDTDDILIRFNNNAVTTFNPAVEAPYRPGFGLVSLSSMSSDQVPLAINMLPLPKSSEKIGINVSATSDGIYSLSMKNLVGIPQLFDIWLMDSYKKDSLDMRYNATYSFNVLKSDTNSFGSKRFSLVIRQNPAYAYRLLNFTASKVSGTTPQVQLAWVAENEQNYTNFTVERSTDGGKTFEVVGGMAGSNAGNYGLADKNPETGTNLYRLKSEDINNSITYSNVIPIAFSNLSNNLVQSNINVYPNPASSVINLAITANLNTPAAYNIQITNSSGLVIRQSTSAQPNWQTSVSDLLPGTYVIKVMNGKDQSPVGNSKFVKQ